MQDLITKSYIDSQVAQFNLSDAGIQELNNKYGHLIIKDLGDIIGYKQVKEARLHVKEIRVALEKKRKELVENPMRIKQSIDAEAKHRREQLELLESKLEGQELPFEQEKERIKKEKLAAIEEKYQNRIQTLYDIGFKFINGHFNFEHFSYSSDDLRNFSDENFEISLQDPKKLAKDILLLREEQEAIRVQKEINNKLIYEQEQKEKEELLIKRNAELEIEREKIKAERLEKQLEMEKLQQEKQELLKQKMAFRHQLMMKLNLHFEEITGIYSADFLPDMIMKQEIEKLSDSEFEEVMGNYQKTKENHIQRLESLESSIILHESIVEDMQGNIKAILLDTEPSIDEFITITKKEYEYLIKRDRKLSALESEGKELTGWSGIVPHLYR